MRERIAILTLALLLALPATAVATWGAKGAYEPDTSLDKTGGYMWQNATDSYTGNKVYFNAFTVQQATGHFDHGLTDNPNLATAQTGKQAWPGQAAALLGVWTDCNKDGYVGLGDQGLFEYRSDLLLDHSLCPPTPVAKPTPNSATYNWSGALVHNDGQWVREFVPIGPDANRCDAQSCQADANRFDVNDLGARVWADWGKPGDPPNPTRCYLFAPFGAYHSTGGFLQYTDCFDGFAVTDGFDTVVDAAGNPGGLSFEQCVPSDTQHASCNHDQYDSASPLNMPNPWGDPSGSSDATVWDCSHPLTPHEQPSSAVGVGLFAPSTDPRPNTAGTIGGTANATASGTDDCNTPASTGQDRGAVVGNLPYSEESGRGLSITSDGIRHQTDFVLAYNEGQRDPFIAVAGPIVAGQLGSSTSSDLGTRAGSSSEGIWLSTTVIAEDHNPYANREVVKSGSAFAPVQYITTYGFVSPTAVSTYHLTVNPSGSTGVYGSEACQGATTGVHNMWHCDPTQWWPGTCAQGYDCCGAGYSCQGVIAGNPVDVSVNVGQPYNVRDVDCYDDSAIGARDAGVGYGVLSNSACQ